MPQDVRDNTVIIFIGDNGTPGQVSQRPFFNKTVKGSLYQGGINTPLFVSGYGVSKSGSDDNLICSSDLFATISEIAGIATNEINDSKSFKPLLTESGSIRNYQYSEKASTNSEGWAISNGTYKLIEDGQGGQELYNLVDDPYENTDLIGTTLSAAAETAKTDLENELKSIRN